MEAASDPLEGSVRQKAANISPVEMRDEMLTPLPGILMGIQLLFSSPPASRTDPQHLWKYPSGFFFFFPSHFPTSTLWYISRISK
jgi:hypothetical protein